MANPRRYAATGSGAIASGGRSILILTSATTIRPALYDLQIGFATPSDNSIQWVVQRVTATGTNSSVTPAAIDSSDPSSLATAGENATAEPTKTASTEMIDEELNQRASYRWVAAPGGELIAPATANYGFALWVAHTSATATARATFHYSE